MRNVTIAATIVLLFAVAPVAHAQSSADRTVDDSTIAATIKAGLFDNRHTSAARINVASHQGVVQLSGFARSEEERAAATKVAAGVSGVKEVINSVTVAPGTSFGTKLEDSLITGRVKAALMDSADVKSLRIDVETRGGVTQLAGFVDSAAMKDKAGRIAAGINGVARVENALVVKAR